MNRKGFSMWEELQQIASTIRFTESLMQLFGTLVPLGNTPIQSLYAVINDRGVRQVFTPVMWKVIIPPRIHIFFVWLLADNKVLTRDNLSKRKNLDDKTCLFCSEYETMHHLFFLVLCGQICVEDLV